MAEGGGEFLPPVVARMLGNITEFKASMAEARGEMDKTEEHGKSSGLETAGKWGGAIAAGAATAALAIGAYSVKAGMDMQTADGALAAHGDLSVAQATRIGDAFLNQGFKFTVSGQQMVAALAPVAGQLATVDHHALTTGESLTFMTNATHLAEASHEQLSATTKDLAGVLQAYNVTAANSGTVTDELWNVSRTAGIGLDSLATLTERLHSKLGEVSPSLGDVSALIEDMARHGVTGRAAVSGVTTALTTLLGGSKATKAEIKDLNLNLYNSQGQFVGMGSVLAQLTPKLAGMTKEQQIAAYTALFSKGAASSLFQMLKDGAPAYDAAAAAATRHGTASEAASKATDNMKGNMERLGAGVQNLATKLGEWLIPKITILVGWITQAVTWLSKHKEVAEILAGVIGGVLVAAFAAWAISAASAAAATIAATWPILAIIAAIGLLVAAIVYAYTHWAWFRIAVQAAWQGIVAAAQWAWNSVLKPLFGALKDFILNEVVPAVLWLWHNVFDPAFHAIAAVVQWAWTNVIQPAFAVGKQLIADIATVVTWLWQNVFTPAWQGISAVVTVAWGVLSAIFGYVKTGISDIQTVISVLQGVWDTVWSTVKGAVSDAWNFISGIFDKIKNGVNDVLKVLKSIPGAGLVTGAAHALFNSKDTAPSGSGSASLWTAPAQAAATAATAAAAVAAVPNLTAGADRGTQVTNNYYLTVEGHVLTVEDLVQTLRSAMMQNGAGNPEGVLGQYASTSAAA